MSDRCLVIAEAGVNHDGDLQQAKELVSAAAEAGADYVKFQTFHSGDLAVKNAPKSGYQKKGSPAAEGQLEMLRRLELPDDSFAMLREYAESLRIGFMSSPFDLRSINVLAELGLPTVKIPSGEINNLPYLRAIASRGWDILLSTGMSTEEEIRGALDVIVRAGKAASSVTLLHCTTEYPAPVEEANLLAIPYMRDKFPECAGIGFSDHTPGIETALGAVALGASIIEKHFTLDKSFSGPDHAASLDPAELKSLTRGVAAMSLARGHAAKTVAPAERQNRFLVRKSIVASRNIAAGEIFSADNLAIKRPGTGLSPMRWDEVLGRMAKHDISCDALLEEADIGPASGRQA